MSSRPPAAREEQKTHPLSDALVGNLICEKLKETAPREIPFGSWRCFSDSFWASRATPAASKVSAPAQPGASAAADRRGVEGPRVPQHLG